MTTIAVLRRCNDNLARRWLRSGRDLLDFDRRRHREQLTLGMFQPFFLSKGTASRQAGIGERFLDISTDERRLLELLAESTNGATDALLIAHGFTLDLMVGLVRRSIRFEPNAPPKYLPGPN